MRTKTLTTEAQRSHREPQRGSANAPRFIFQQPARVCCPTARGEARRSVRSHLHLASGVGRKNQKSRKLGVQKPFDAIEKFVRRQMWAKSFSQKSPNSFFRQTPSAR